MTGTYPCTWDGCNMVFKREFQLRKHRAIHEDPESVHRCSYCDFYTLDPRNLDTHIAKHTGEKRYICPNTNRVHDEPGSAACEAQCSYQTNDRSLLTKHRIKQHGYIPRRRSSPTERPVNLTFVSSRRSVAAPTKKITTSVRRQKEVVKQKDAVKLAKDHAVRKRKKGKGPQATRDASESASMSQDNIDSLFAVGSSTDSAPVAVPSSAANNNNVQSVLVFANQGDSTRYNQSAQGIPPDQYGNIAPMAPEQGISSSYTAVYNTVAPIGAQQNIWDKNEGFVNPRVTYASYNHATLDQWANYNNASTPLDQDQVYGYMDFTGWDFTGTFSNAMPAMWNNTANTFNEYTLQQDVQGQSAHGMQSTSVAPDQGMTGYAFQPTDDDWSMVGSTSTQLPSVGGAASTESSTGAEDVEDYLSPYPYWVSEDFWNEISAPLKQQSVRGMDSVVSSTRAEDYLCPVPDWVPAEIWDRMWAPC